MATKLLAAIGVLFSLLVESSYGHQCSIQPCTLNNGWCSTSSTNYDAGTLGLKIVQGGTVCLPDGSIPVNNVKCFKHRLCNNQSRLKNWSKSLSLVTVHTSEDTNEQTVYMDSPRFPKKNYRNSDICVYNISLSGCSSTSSRINYDSFDIAGPNDYVQLIYNGGVSEKKYISDLEGDNDVIAATNFLVVFFTSKSINDNGFRIRAQCG